MAVPKRRVAHGRKARRRSHMALTAAPISVDKQTKSVHRHHHVDLRTGLYRGKQVLFKEEPQADAGAGSQPEQPKA